MDSKKDIPVAEYNEILSKLQKSFHESTELLEQLMNCVPTGSSDDDYITEDVRNNLPAWRDDILPIIMELDENGKETGNYEEDSAFRHIMDNHTWNRRVRILLGTKQVVYGDEEQGIVGILTTFNLTVSQYRPVRDSIRNKLMANQKLTSSETKIIEYVLSINNKSLFPKEMSDRHVYKTIQEAYADARKIHSPQTSHEKDKDNPDEKVTRNMMKYQGRSEKLVIEFEFDTISKTIQTAYPVYRNKE